MPEDPGHADNPEDIRRMIRRAYENLSEWPGYFNDSGMLPPWKFEPNYPMASLFWKMGGGEDYRNDFFRFFESLDETAKASFIQENPEPADWKGFYADFGK